MVEHASSNTLRIAEMEMYTFRHTKDKGWSIKEFPAVDSPNTLILIFASPSYHNAPEPFRELTHAYPQACMIGCSGAGEIADCSILDESLSVAILPFRSTRLRDIKVPIQSHADSFAAGQKIAEELKEEKLKSIFVLSEGLNVNGSELVKGFNSVLPTEVTVTGGLAGDGPSFNHTWAIYKGQICHNSIVAVGFYGDKITVKHSSQGGWDIFGPERRVTRSKDNILYELDGQPVLPLYKRYLGERSEGLPATGLLFPLAIRRDKNDKDHLVRTILGIDEKTQSLTFAGDIPSGYLGQLMRASFERLIASAEEAAEEISGNKEENKPVFCIAVSCVGRRLLLGERTEEETEAVFKTLPKNSKMVGFYSYGELSPLVENQCSLHNQTMTLTTICEE